MSTNSSAGSGGIGLGSLLAVVFVVLKLTGHIAWSWWWVLSPVWIPVGLVIAFLGGGVVVICIKDALDRKR